MPCQVRVTIRGGIDVTIYVDGSRHRRIVNDDLHDTTIVFDAEQDCEHTFRFVGGGVVRFRDQVIEHAFVTGDDNIDFVLDRNWGMFIFGGRLVLRRFY